MSFFYLCIGILDSLFTRMGLILSRPITRITRHTQSEPRLIDLSRILGVSDLPVTDNYYFGYLSDYTRAIATIVTNGQNKLPDVQNVIISNTDTTVLDVSWDVDAPADSLGNDLKILINGEDISDFLRDNVRGTMAFTLVQTEVPIFTKPVNVLMMRFFRPEDAMLVRLRLP